MKFKDWKRWWVDRAETYFTDKIWQFSKPSLIERLEIGKDHHVLELGFGYGREISQFCQLSNNVFGLELTEWMCQATLLELGEMGVDPLPTLLTYDGKKIPFRAGTFDVVYSCFLIQHLSRKHAKDTIKEALRVIKPSGKVLFEFFGDPQYYADGKDYLNPDGQGGFMFNSSYKTEDIEKLIADCGGKVDWIEHAPVTQEWGNHWCCFGKK